jgi:two-component system OmpR family response regulator
MAAKPTVWEQDKSTTFNHSFLIIKKMSPPTISRPHVLLIEDEYSLSRPIEQGLNEEGYLVEVVDDGLRGLESALEGRADLLIVDWRLPGLDGRTLIERLREEGIRTPVLMLTALQDVTHRVAGLDAGADDYLTKPFAFDELLARLRALQRRTEAASYSESTPPEDIRFRRLRVAPDRHMAWVGNQPLTLRTKELRLLEQLVRLGKRVATRAMLAEEVWDSAFEVTDNAINVTVSNLRQRLSEVTNEVGIETVRGMGYRLVSVDGKGDD